MNQPKERAPQTAATVQSARAIDQIYSITPGRGKQEAKATLDGVRRSIWDIYALLDFPIVRLPLEETPALPFREGRRR